MKTCITCEGPIYGGDREPDECYHCRNAVKCGKCGKPVSVRNCIQYCPRCEPILAGVKHIVGSEEEKTVLMPEEEAKREFAYQVEDYSKGWQDFIVTIQLWRQDINPDGSRYLEKIREVVIKTDFRRGRKPKEEESY